MDPGRRKSDAGARPDWNPPDRSVYTLGKRSLYPFERINIRETCMASLPEIFEIPFEEKLILYRPLIRTAFVGNRAMANLTAELLEKGGKGDGSKASSFLEEIGFLRPDPPPARPEPGDNYLPMGATLFLTNRCNLSCAYCYASSGEEPPEDMGAKLALAAVDFAHDSAQSRFSSHFELAFHGGGEPTMNWETMRAAVSRVREKALPSLVSMATNGVYGREKAEWIAENLDGVSLSLDGPAHIQDRQRPSRSGGGSFQAVMKTIETFDRKGLHYGVRITADEISMPEFASSVKFVLDNAGPRKIQVEPVFPQGRGGGEWMGEESLDRFIEEFKSAHDLCLRRGVALVYSGARPEITSGRFCRAGSESLVVTPRGELTACFEVYSSRHPLARHFFFGRIDESGRPVLDKNKLRSLLDSRAPERLEYCRECFCKWHCAGDCMAKTFSESGPDKFKPTPRCRVNRELTKYLLLKYISSGGGVWRGSLPGGS